LLSVNEATTCRVGAKDAEERSTIAASALALVLALAAVTMLVGYSLMPDLLGQERNHLVPLARAYLLVFVPFNFVGLALLFVDLGRLAFRAHNILRLFVPATYLIGLLALWATEAVSVGLVVAVNCVATVLTTLTCLTLHGRVLRVLPSASELRQLFRLAIRFHPTTLVIILAAHADRIAVLLFWDNTAMGHYVVALTLAGSGLAVVSGAFQRVLFPHLVQEGDLMYRGQFLARSVRHAAISLGALSVPLTLAMPLLVPFLFGPAFGDAVPLAVVLTGVYPLVALQTILIQGLRALGSSLPGFVAAGLSLVVFSTLVWPLGVGIGLVGVGVALALASIPSLCYLARHLMRTYGISVRVLLGVSPSPLEMAWQNGESRSTPLGGQPGIPRVYVAMLGARAHYAVPRLLERGGMLGQFYTDVYAGTAWWLRGAFAILPDRFCPRWVQRLLGRFSPDLPSDKIVAFNAHGLFWFIRRWWARDVPTLERAHAREAASFNSLVSGHLSARTERRSGDIVFAFNGASTELLQRAKERGMACMLEQTIAPSQILRTLLHEELRRWPGWQPNLHLQDPSVMEQREEREWQLADAIVCGSRFVFEALKACGVGDGKCHVVPYGIPLDRFPARSRERADQRLRILFAGEVGLRKGVQYLLEALGLLRSRQVDVRLAGTVALDHTRLRPYAELVNVLGPVPRRRMPILFQWADVVVLPSVCEGSALVTYEALASGVPVIATPNAGAPLRDGVDGVLVPLRNATALATAIDRFATDGEFLQWCSQNAVLTRKELGFDAYGERLMSVVNEAAGVVRDGWNARENV
jgi:glycosyltransferase involved in cell wall biosynthesis/O-antigen/teichoic acid export membrane protein